MILLNLYKYCYNLCFKFNFNLLIYYRYNKYQTMEKKLPKVFEEV